MKTKQQVKKPSERIWKLFKKNKSKVSCSAQGCACEQNFNAVIAIVNYLDEVHNSRS